MNWSILNSAMTTFDLLHPKIQESIYRMKWEYFHPIQDEAINYLISSPGDMLICAPTAGGKTEAAFLPIISNIIETGNDSIKVMYISPLKALINDQFERIESLCNNIDFPITKWHGDASASKKIKLTKNPQGILLITPESIESLFQNKFAMLKKMFSQLEYIVIDEIHYFIENERGTHLRSLLQRLETVLEITPIKIGLSATINNPNEVTKFLNREKPESVKIIKTNDDEKEILGLIKTFSNDKIFEDIFSLCKVSKNLLFANTKATLELFCDSMKTIAQKEKYSNTFYIHHGSLSKEIRENTETKLKKDSNISVFCTNTLELGIDIGTIKRVIFLNPPFSVSSLIQRLGRSGRKEKEAKEFRFFLLENDEEEKLSWDDKFHIPLIQSIAMVELMLEKWCEPLIIKRRDFSTFIHQILSYLAKVGTSSAVSIYENIGKNSFFGEFSQSEFIDILKSLHEKEIIYQMSDNTITLNKKGEEITSHYDFYAAFQNPTEWKIVCDGKEIGSLPSQSIMFLELGVYFLLAGKRWVVEEILKSTLTILVKPAIGKKSISFGGGIIDIHSEIHHKMLEIYSKKFFPKYLSKSSASSVEKAYEYYKTYIEPDNSNILIVLEGAKVQRTIELLLFYLGIPHHIFGLGIYSEIGKSELTKSLKSFNFKEIDINDILRIIPSENKMQKKFDNLLPEKLLNKSYAENYLDFEQTELFCKNLK